MEFLGGLFRFGNAARIPGPLLKNAHRIDIGGAAWAGGYISGHALLLGSENHEAAEGLKEQGNVKAAWVLTHNRKPILSQAITHGIFHKHIKKLVSAFEGGDNTPNDHRKKTNA